MKLRFTLLLWVACILQAQAYAQAAAADDVITNPFQDPFFQLTRGIPACATPLPPRYTRQDIAQLNHERTQRGVSCWIAGRCRLMNSYAYDAEIAERVQKAVAARGTFDNSSVWILGQRRYIWLKGCVAHPQQATDLARLIKNIDDVEGVFLELSLGAQTTPPYATPAQPIAPQAAQPFVDKP
jgi:hypothetical protein